jgi:hypothetical protein
MWLLSLRHRPKLKCLPWFWVGVIGRPILELWQVLGGHRALCGPLQFCKHPDPGASPQPTPTWLHSSLQHTNPQQHPQTPFRGPQQLVFYVFCVLYTHHTLHAGWGHPGTGWGDGHGRYTLSLYDIVSFSSNSHTMARVPYIGSRSTLWCLWWPLWAPQTYQVPAHSSKLTHHAPRPHTYNRFHCSTCHIYMAPLSAFRP